MQVDRRLGWIAGAALFAGCAIAAPWLDGFTMSLLTLVFLFAWFGQAWNLAMGFTGQLSLGHALFAGLGGYAVVIITTRYGLSPWFGLLIGMPIAAAAGAAIGWLAFRFGVRDVYFALLAIAVAEMMRVIFSNWNFVGGTGGIFLPALSPTNEPLRTLRGGALFYYAAALFLATAGTALLAWLRGARIGYLWRALRDDEAAARALGVRAPQHKILACAISAAMTALGGALYAHLNGVIFPDSMMGMALSIQIIIGPILGGLGTVFGPLVGALVVVPLGEISGTLGQSLGISGMNSIGYGLALILLIGLLPGGLWPAIVAGVQSLWRRR